MFWQILAIDKINRVSNNQHTNIDRKFMTKKTFLCLPQERHDLKFC